MTPEQIEQMDRLYSYCLLSGKILFGLLTVTLFYPYTKFVLLNLMKNHRYAFSTYQLWQETNIVGQVFMVCGDTIPTNYPSPILSFLFIMVYF